MGIRCTEHGKELGAQSKSILGDVDIRENKGGNGGYVVFSKSDGKVLFHSHYRTDCIDFKASMYGLFRYVASVPWRVELEDDEPSNERK